MATYILQTGQICQLVFVRSSNLRKLKVNLNPTQCISCVLFTMPFFQLAFKTKVKGVFNRSYCCYSPLCHENDDNVFTSDWAVLFICAMIVALADKE